MQMLPGMCRGEQCGCASRSLALPLPAEALLPRGIGDCVLCQQLQEPFVVTLIGKKKEEKSVAEIQFWWKIPRGWCLGGGCVYFLLFLACPSLFPFPFHKKKGFFFSFFFWCVVFFPTTKSVWKTRLVPRGPFYNQKKKVNIGKFSFFCVFLSLFFAELEINLFIFLVFYCSVSRCAPCHPPYSQGAGKYGRGEKLYI